MAPTAQELGYIVAAIDNVRDCWPEGRVNRQRRRATILVQVV